MSKILLALFLFTSPMPVTPAKEPTAAIRFPTVTPAPLPPPPPINVSKLLGDQLYVIDSDVPIMVLPGRLGIVKIEEQAGALTIRAKFVDSKDVETRTYKGKQVFLIESAGTGSVDLLVIPTTGKQSEVIRKTLDVYADIAPIPPPPDPKPDPKPDPVQPAPIPVAGYKVLIVEESNERHKLSKDQFNALFGKATRDWLDANCPKEGNQPGYRIYDKDQTSTGDLKHWQDALKRPRTSVPWLIVSNPAVGGWEGPLPATTAEIQAILNKYVK